MGLKKWMSSSSSDPDISGGSHPPLLRPVLPTYARLLCRFPELQWSGKMQWLSHRVWPRGKQCIHTKNAGVHLSQRWALGQHCPHKALPWACSLHPGLSTWIHPKANMELWGDKGDTASPSMLWADEEGRASPLERGIIKTSGFNLFPFALKTLR